MSPTGAGASELRVLVVAPIGRDAEVTCEALRDAGLSSRPCAGLEELRRELATGAGAIVVTVEALGADGVQGVARLLEAQEPWSDLPVVLVAASGEARTQEAIAGRLRRAGAVTVLERPIRLLTLQTVVRAALRARQRQYDMRDLLEELRVTVERLDAEHAVRERFVSLLAHDVRGPLSAAMLAAKVLVARPESLDERRDLALRIDRSMLRIDRMIQDLLDANRLRAGHRLPLDLRACDVVEIATDVVADLDDASRRRIRTEAPDRVEGVWAPDQLRRALWNLVTNALKYGTPDAPVDVRIASAAGTVSISVHNEGPAIPAEEQRQIFEPFGRARAAEARAKGWGLGLTLVRGCAEAHGGTLDLASAPGEGTTFTLRLPLDARPFQPPDAAPP